MNTNSYINTFRDAAIDACLPAQEVAILCTLARHANSNTGITWPGLALIGEKICLSERSVSRYIGNLIEKGWIELVSRGSNGTGRGGIPNKYRLVVPDSQLQVQPEFSEEYDDDPEEF